MLENNLGRGTTLIEDDNATDSDPRKSMASAQSSSRQGSMISLRKDINGRFETNLTGLSNWPPSSLEIEALITGTPVMIQVAFTNGEVVSRQVDEASTVETLFDSIRETHPALKHEHETETFWLFRQHGVDPDQFTTQHMLDFPLPKDKKILKLMY